MRRAPALAAAAAITVLLSSCVLTDQNSLSVTTPSVDAAVPNTLLASDGGQKAIVHSGPWSAPVSDAELKGVLGNDGAGCLVLLGKDGYDYTLIFPEGTSFDAETLILPAGPPISAGDPLFIAGARVPADPAVSLCQNYARLMYVRSAAVLH